jgi:hypothetical protein
MADKDVLDAAKQRLLALALKEFGPDGLTPEERAEQKALDALMPPPDPADPLYELKMRWEEVDCEGEG